MLTFKENFMSQLWKYGKTEVREKILTLNSDICSKVINEKLKTRLECPFKVDAAIAMLSYALYTPRSGKPRVQNFSEFVPTLISYFATRNTQSRRPTCFLHDLIGTNITK